jgi:SAM-dependent methyltransferase
MPDVPFRLHWFATLVPPDATRPMLEVGCGSGILLELLAARCPRAELVGIDRSELQVRRAAQRLAKLPRVTQVHHLALESAGVRLGVGRFGLVVAMNVNVVWTRPEAAGAALRTLLAHDGRVLLGYEPPTPGGREALRTKLLDAISGTGFVPHVEHQPSDSTPGVFAIELRRRSQTSAGRQPAARLAVQKRQRSQGET